MRTPRGKQKGQGLVEYAVIIFLIVIAVFLLIPPFISGVRYFVNTIENSLGLQTPATAPPTSPSNSNNNLATIIVTIFATTGIPAGVSVITSFYDGAIDDSPSHVVARKRKVQRDDQGRCSICGAVKSYGRLSAKLCLSAISFEVWGITNASQQQVALRPAVKTDQLIVILIFLILINIGLHYMCSKRISDKNMELRVFLFILSILIPVGTFYNLTV